jgi:hypothetical protein
MATNPQVPEALGALKKTPPLPGCILTIRVASLGHLERLELRRYTGDYLVDGKQYAWPKGHLDAPTVAEMEASVVDQLRLALLAHFGIQADLFEGLTP